MAMTTMPGEQASATAPRGVQYGDLNRTHKDYDADKIARMRLLHEGGWKILDAAKQLILKAPQEPDAFYDWRVKCTSYVNLLALVTGYLVGALFRAPVVVKPAPKPGDDGATPFPDPDFYDAFVNDCDEERTNFSQFVRRATAQGLIYGRSVVGVDMPPNPGAETRGEEELLGGAESYLYPVEPEELINWEYVRAGRRQRRKDGKRMVSVRGFRWCVLKRMHVDQDGPRAPIRTRAEFKLWSVQTVELASGAVEERAVYEVWRTVRTLEELHGARDFEDIEPMVLVDEGVTSFERVPLICFEPPSDICIGEQAGPLCLEHFRKRSDLAGATQRSLVEIPFVKRGPEIGAPMGLLPSETQQDPNRGADPVGQAKSKGFVAIGSGDEIGFAGPSGRAFELSARQLVELEETINRVTVTMALRLENSAAAVGRSGESKKEDRSATEVVLDYLSQEVRELAAEIYETVSRGRSDPETKWVASGCDSFDQEDASVVIEQTVTLNALRIPSKTAKRKIFERCLGVVFPDMSDDERKQMADELSSGIDAEEDLRGAQNDAGIRVAEQTGTGEEGGPQGLPPLPKLGANKAA